MNKYQKYQEALDYLTGLERKEVFKRIGAVAPHPNSDTLQELVDKVTPKKPKGLSICPDCENHLYIDQQYCDKCGTEIDWSCEDD